MLDLVGNPIYSFSTDRAHEKTGFVHVGKQRRRSASL